MKNETILKIENLSKQYRLGKVGTGTLGHDINRVWAKMRGKEDPYLKVGSVNDRSVTASSEYVWALKDINFEVKRGEIVGIIGKNGAGKSTLLKILSRVTSPSTGSIKVRGRMASLLEVGTGMHPELTGRENIYLNGAILGMTKAEISSKIDEIIEFSGCQMYIDTPVKRYSSGMGVRLGFAVAAFLEPDILVVDEVLAVGDAEFQKKAIGKMQDISNTGGRTVLFVSHNMASIKQLCTRAIVLENGISTFDGFSKQAIDYYLNSNLNISSAHYINELWNKSDLIEIAVLDKRSKLCDKFSFDDSINIKVSYSVEKEKIELNPIIGVKIKDYQGRIIFTTQSHLQDINAVTGKNTVIIKLPDSFLVPNTYFVSVGFHIKNRKVIKSVTDIVSFKIEETGSEFDSYSKTDYGCVIANCKWLSV